MDLIIEKIAEQSELGKDKMKSEEDKGKETDLSAVVVRVKRKRAEVADAPSVLLIPHRKKRMLDTVHSALENMGIQKEAKNTSKEESEDDKMLLVCSLIGKRKMESDDSSDQLEEQHVFHKNKRVKIVELEMNARGVSKLQKQTTDADKMDYAVWHAVTSGNFGPLSDLLKDPGTDVNFQRGIDGVTPLMAACSFCNVEIVSMLIDRGADALLQDWNGIDARHRVASRLPPSTPHLDDFKSQIYSLLELGDYEYDTYIIKEQRKAPPAGEKSSNDQVWTSNGTVTAWEDAPVADIELDLDDLDHEGGELNHFDDDASSARSSDYENEDDERYVHNDYPDEHEDEDGEDDCSDGVCAMRKRVPWAVGMDDSDEGNDSDCSDGGCALNKANANPWAPRYDDDDDDLDDSFVAGDGDEHGEFNGDIY